MDTNKLERCIDYFESLLEGYNNCNHSSIGLPPNIAGNDKPTYPQIREKIHLMAEIEETKETMSVLVEEVEEVETVLTEEMEEITTHKEEIVEIKEAERYAFELVISKDSS